MKVLMVYLYVFFSLGCLFLVASEQDMNEGMSSFGRVLVMWRFQ